LHLVYLALEIDNAVLLDALGARKVSPPAIPNTLRERDGRSLSDALPRVLGIAEDGGIGVWNVGVGRGMVLGEELVRVLIVRKRQRRC
jgi:hypothetical protein